jgi:hypothetical protein
MTQKEVILQAFKENGNVFTLGYALQYTWGYKVTSRISDLRKDGYQIDYERGEIPTKNRYVLTPKQDNLL